MGRGSSNHVFLLGGLLIAGVADLAWLNLSLAPRLAAELAEAEVEASAVVAKLPPSGAPPESRDVAGESLAPKPRPADRVASKPSIPENRPETPAAAPRPDEQAKPKPVAAAGSAPPAAGTASPEATGATPRKPLKASVEALPSPLNLRFSTASAALTADSRRMLRRASRMLERQKDLRLHLRGHADRRGSEEYNLGLAAARAEAAQRYLIGLGVTPERVTTESAGADQPLDSSNTPDAWAKNRRVELEWRR